jgi:polyhydroxybutyrate depolymerase
VQRHELSVGGTTRSYRLFAPLSLDRERPAPLVLVLAGVGNTGESMVEATGFDRVADREGFLAAYPEGINQTWNAGYCCLGRATSGPDDVAFLSRVIEDVEARYNVDPARVFAVGVSAGGMMAYRLGCELAGRIAGIGSVAGAMILDECQPTRAVSVIEIHGTADGLVPYEGGPTAGGATQPSPPTVAVAERWAQLNACPSPPVIETDGPISTTTWTGCRDGTAVTLITLDGGGHTWFAQGLGAVNGAIDATDAIWGFLSNARRAG